MPWWGPAVIISTSTSPSSSNSSLSPNSTHPPPDNNINDTNGDLPARRQRKPKNLPDADTLSTPTVNSPDTEIPRDRFQNNKNRNAPLSSSTSTSRGSSVIPEPHPQPLPLPADGHSAIKRLPSPGETPSRFTETGTCSDLKIKGLNEGINDGMEPISRRPSRKAPQNLTFVDVESNKFSLPFRSAPTSPYNTPPLSPQRKSTGEMFSYHYTSPQKNQILSYPEMPFPDGYTAFPSPASPEQIKYSPDSFGVRGSNNHYSLNARSPQHVSRNPSRATSPHPLPLPPGASSPSSAGALLPAPPSSPLPTPSAPLPTPSVPLPAPTSSISQVTSRPEFSSANNWQKGKLIGRGTFGSVYVATNLQTGALCAMKEVELIPDDPKSTECMKQLEQEIKLLSQLQHLNIVQYYGSQIVDDKLYIFLEYVHPGAISKYIRDHCGAITEAVVRNFTRHILSGLAYLHSKKTVHRDIKGANLLVDSAGVVKLADFGMAKHFTGQAANLSLKGSPYWMAPELMQSVMQKDMKPDHAFAVDIWSLGCTIIEMLNGKPPWSEYEGAAAMFKVMRETPSIPSTLSLEGKDFLQCCFRRNPVERPTANALLEHPFLRSPQQDVQSCVIGLSEMKIKDNVLRSEALYSYNHEQLQGIPGAQMKPLRPPDSFTASSFHPTRLATSGALT